MSLIVVRAGFLTSVQDLGRMGFREFGVSSGGALDSFGLRVTNLLVGNDEGAAGLEITLGGLLLHFEDERVIVVVRQLVLLPDVFLDLAPRRHGQPPG